MTDNDQQLLTPDGYKKLQEELHVLRERRKEISKRIEQAKELGDLSENAEYSSAKDDQAFTEGRILELEDLVHSAIVVAQPQTAGDSVQLGSTIDVDDTEHHRMTFTIVGINEADPAKGYISNESPLGQAFLNRRLNDTIEVRVPAGIKNFRILRIH